MFEVHLKDCMVLHGLAQFVKLNRYVCDSLRSIILERLHLQQWRVYLCLRRFVVSFLYVGKREIIVLECPWETEVVYLLVKCPDGKLCSALEAESRPNKQFYLSRCNKRSVDAIGTVTLLD